jgi:hypothetical protein
MGAERRRRRRFWLLAEKEQAVGSKLAGMGGAGPGGSWPAGVARWQGRAGKLAGVRRRWGGVQVGWRRRGVGVFFSKEKIFGFLNSTDKWGRCPPQHIPFLFSPHHPDR